MTNWSDYDRALVARGDLTLWITPEALEAWRPARSGRRGAQPKFSDLAIETALTPRTVFHLALRQAEGFLRSILRIMDLEIESVDHTTLSRWGEGLVLDPRAIARNGPVHLLSDSSGLSAHGEGEWAVTKHGAKGLRRWRKLHLSVDSRSLILARCLTDATTDDASTALDLLATITGTITSVTADGVYDTTAFYEAAGTRGASVVVPPSTTATSSREPRARASPATEPSSAYRKLDEGRGRRKPATTSKPEQRTPSSDTRRSSVTACAHEARQGARSRRA